MAPSPRRLAAALLTATLVTLPLVSCSDDGDGADGARARTTATTTTTTTDPAGGDATGSPAAPAGSGADDAADAALPPAFTIPGEPSPLTLGTGEPEPEYPAGADGSTSELADGRLDLLVQQVDTDGGAVLVDAVQLIVGDGARPAAEADGKLRPGEELAGGYYVRDLNPKLRLARLADGVRLTAPDAEPVTGRRAVAAVLVERLTTEAGIPYAVTVDGGRITELAVPDITDPTNPG